MADMTDAFQNVMFAIGVLEEADTGPTPDPQIIDFPSQFGNPAISVDTGNRFIDHEIIGGSTVRQRIGNDPMEVDVNGVCNETIVREIEKLRNVEIATIYSNRFRPSSTINVHIESVSTQPFEEGGSVQLGDEEFLYSYTLNCVEVPGEDE